jgi:hypothetical protein
MPKIVISYRRDDSDAIAGRIRDRLANHYGEQSVFMDIDSVPLGVNFREYISKALLDTDVMLVIIGPRWITRIENTTDPVRVELEKAFELGIQVVPVLVSMATMPNPNELPESIRELSDINAAFVDSRRDFHAHVDRLIRYLDSQIQFKGGQTTLVTPSRNWLQLIVGVAAVGGIAAAIWLLTSRDNRIVPETTTPGPGSPMGISCDEEKNLRSLDTKNPTSISFTNKSEKTKRVYWLNHAGKRVLYATLKRDQFKSIQTYISHPWVVTNISDECEVIYMPTPDKQEVIIAR